MVRCGSCRSAIVGRVSGFAIFDYRGPQFCVNCGSPYPWATRDERVTRIKTLLAEAKLPEGNRLALREQLAVLRESSADPRTQKRQVAVLRALQKAAPDVWSKAKPVIVSIATDLMRRDFGLPG